MSEIDSTPQTFTIDEDSKPAHQAASATRKRWANALRLVGVTALLIAVLIGAFAHGRLSSTLHGDEALITLIIGEWFPTLFDFAIAAIALGIAAIVCSAFVNTPTSTRRGKWLSVAFASAIVAAVAISLPATAIVSGMQLLSRDSYSLLPGQSEAGCRIVVSEWAFLLAGGGSGGIVQPESIVVQWTRGYTADDGQTPFSRGNYTLDWHGQTADLRIRGTSSDPVWWNGHDPLVCEK